jgi:hypothetical protein
MTEHRGQFAKIQNSMRAPSSKTRFGGMLKKSVAALALRAMKLNRCFRHRIIGAGPVGRSRALSTSMSGLGKVLTLVRSQSGAWS